METKHYLYQKGSELTDVQERLQTAMEKYNVTKLLRITIEYNSGATLDLTDYTTDMHKLEIVQQIVGTIAGDLRDIEKQIKQQIVGNI